jgi:hypothetical protein
MTELPAHRFTAVVAAAARIWGDLVASAMERTGRTREFLSADGVPGRSTWGQEGLQF